VYRFASPHSPDYDGLQVEIQLRSRLQHAWATAVETVGTLLRQALKASEGEQDWLRFFQLAGSAFAIVEGSQLVPNTPTTKRELVRDLSRLMKDLTVEQKLNAYRLALRTTERESRAKAHYYLLDLRPSEGTLSVRGYSKEALDQATADYLNRERQLTIFSSSEAVCHFPRS
jgi:hypothetical protein